jgi:hypothetical protein
MVLIEPADSQPVIEIPIAAEAVDYITPGQTIDVAVGEGSFASTRSMKARVLSVTRLPAKAQNSSPDAQQQYVLIARSLRSDFIANGRRITLKPGLSVHFRLVLERKPLFDWLFDKLT